jgi:hypothetical protein
MGATNRYLRDTNDIISLKSRTAALEAKTANLGTVTDDYKGYIYLNELRRAGELDDKLALQRAKVIQIDKGFPIWATPGKGSGTTRDDGVDKGTNAAIIVRFRDQVGDYLVDSWSQASDTANGGTLTAPTNNALPNPNDSGNMWSGMTVYGVKGLSRFRRADRNKPYIFTCNPVNTPGTTTNGEDRQAYVFKNIHFNGITLVSNVQSDGFSEYQAQIHASAVEHFLFENCEILGHRGVAIQIANGHIDGGQQNRHNRHVIIRDTNINGANQNNASAIVVTDVDYLTIENVHTSNCAKSGKTFTGSTQDNFNPNSGNPMLASFLALKQNQLVSVSIMRNVTIKDSTSRDGGAAGLAWFFNANTDARQAVNPVQFITADGNTFERLKGGLVTTGSSYAGAEYHASFINNKVVGCRFPFQLAGMNGIQMTGNLFSDCDRNGEIGNEVVGGAEYVQGAIMATASHVVLTDNIFRRVGWANLGAFSIIGASGEISYNTFEDCGGADFTWRGPGITRNLIIDQNKIVNTNPTSPAMTLTMRVYDQSPFPAPNSGKPDIRGESVFVTYHPSNTLQAEGLVAVGARVNRIPQNTSAWPNGASVTTRYDIPRGEFETIRKTGTFTGPSPADRWTPSFAAGSLPILSTVLPTGFVAPGAKTETSTPPGVVFDDNNRLMATKNSEAFWRSQNQTGYTSSLGYPWATCRVAAPSMITGGIIAGLTYNSDYPENWITNNSGLGTVKYGVLFDGGNLRVIVGGAFAGYIPNSLVRAIIGFDQVFLNVIVTIVFNVQTGEGRVLLTHPETKAEIVISSNGTSATGAGMYQMARFTTANEYLRIYN